MADTTTGTSVAIATPDLKIIDGQITTTSLQIAEHFGKQHKDVLRAIKNLLKELPEGYQRNFALIQIDVDLGMGRTRKDPAYRITRDGFTLLAMGFTGKEALQWKLAYITAFNAMEAELLRKAPYTTQPGDTLNEAQQIALRAMLESNVKRLPMERRGEAMRQGWSKLKSHFKVPYRQIPASEFEEALSIIARHVAQWELVDAPQQAQPAIDQLNAQAVAAPQSEPKQMRLDDAVRLDHAFHLASHAAAQVQRAVFNAVMAGEQPNALTSQWMLYFHTKSWGDKATDAHCKPLANDAICLGPDAYLANLERGDGHVLSTDQLAHMAEFATKKLASRVRQQASLAADRNQRLAKRLAA